MTPDADVAVVGYGPVGNTLAILLAQLGCSVIVLERRPESYRLPRAVHFDHEVGRILQSCGIGDELRAITEPVEIYEWRNGSGTTLLRFGRGGPSSTGWPLSSMFNQPALEDLLDRRARSLPGVEVRRVSEVTALEQHPEDVTLRTASLEEVRARYVVGCDGANSTVRELIGTPVCDLGFFYDWLVLIAELSAVLPLFPGDVIFTGTPAGVGVTRQPPRFLQPGQVLQSWVEGIGTICNRCV